MLSGPVIITVALLYLCLLFAIAYYGDKRADQGRSLIANPTIYALSIAVYCTSWTFYGSVGRAASTGVDFLPIYLGPTLTFIVAWLVIRKIIRISKVNRTTSIADFIASRYGKSFQLGGLVTIIAVVGILPYISLQLKAISTSFSLLLQYPEILMPSTSASTLFLQDTGLYVALIMALFAILFGTRHIDASEQHEGMVAAIAFEFGRQARRVSGCRLVRDVRSLWWIRRDFRAGRSLQRAAPTFHNRRRRRLHQLDHADAACHGCHRRSAATIPGAGSGERRRAPPQESDVAVPAVPPAHQRIRAAHRVRRAVAVPGRRRRCRHLRARGTDEGTAAHTRADGLHRGPLGRHRDDHRRDNCIGDHGLQRPRHAAASARGPLASVGAQGSRRHPADDPPRHDYSRGAARLCLCSPDRRSPMRW